MSRAVLPPRQPRPHCERRPRVREKAGASAPTLTCTSIRAFDLTYTLSNLFTSTNWVVVAGRIIIGTVLSTLRRCRNHQRRGPTIQRKTSPHQKKGTRTLNVGHPDHSPVSSTLVQLPRKKG